MKLFLQIFLFLNSIVFLFSCSSTKGFDKQEDLETTQIEALHGNRFTSAMYSAKIDIGEKHFSGLFYFKNLEDSTKRIVFLTQFGLNLLDLEYKNHSFEVKNCKDFLNKKLIINTLKKDFKLLIDNPQKIRKLTKYINKEEQIIKYQTKEGVYFYSLKDGEINNIVQRKGFSHIELKTSGRKENLPSSIEIINKRINLTIRLKLIKAE